MSHSTVMILLPFEPLDDNHLSDMLAELLAPFDENMEVDRYKDRPKPLPANWREVTVRQLPHPWSSVCWPEGEGALLQQRLDEPSVTYAHCDLDDPGAVAKYLNGRYPGEESYLTDAEGLFEWSTYNPQSRWDWYSLGGRWTGYFPLRDTTAPHFGGRPGLMTDAAPPGTADACRRGDVDMAAELERWLGNRRGYWEAWEAKGAEDKDRYWQGIDDSRTIDEYLDVAKFDGFQSYAVLAEGVWRESGKMGWFGMSAASPDDERDYVAWFQRFWMSIPDEQWLAVVDVHI